MRCDRQEHAAVRRGEPVDSGITRGGSAKTKRTPICAQDSNTHAAGLTNGGHDGVGDVEGQQAAGAHGHDAGLVVALLPLLGQHIGILVQLQAGRGKLGSGILKWSQQLGRSNAPPSRSSMHDVLAAEHPLPCLALGRGGHLLDLVLSGSSPHGQGRAMGGC